MEAAEVAVRPKIRRLRHCKATDSPFAAMVSAERDILGGTAMNPASGPPIDGTADTPHADAETPAAAGRHAVIQEAVEHASHYLPTQGPIGVFIAQNMLQAFEGERFEDAVVRASRIYGTEPYLAESRYREELARGRIRGEDLEAVLDVDLRGLAEEPLCGGRLSLRELHLALLLHPVRQEGDAAVRWTLTESNVVERLRDDVSPEMRWQLLSQTDGAAADAGVGGFADVEDESARRATLFVAATPGEPDEERRASSELWHACVEAVALARPSVTHVQPPLRHRDLIVAAVPGIDTDALVHPLLIRWCAAFLDQGVAAWPMPGRDRGLLAAVACMYSSRFGPTEPWSAALPAALRRVRGTSAIEVIAAELDMLGVPESAWREYLTQAVLALRGWAGMLAHLERRPDRAPVEPVPARLVDFVALRLVCDRVAAAWAARQIGFERGASEDGGRLSRLWTELRDRYPPRRGAGSLSRAFMLHQVSQLVGISARDIRGLDENELLRFEQAIVAFDGFSRRRLFHLAYERRHRVETLDALAAHCRFVEQPDLRPAFQAVLCMDDRCESFRRHFEELGPRFETFGTAGFFAVPMYYRGVDDWHASPLCPIVMRPKHTVVEVPEADAVARHEFHRSMRRRVGQLAGGAAVGSRTLFRGGLFTAVAGAIAAVPLVARVAFPRLAARAGRTAAEIARTRIPTRLMLERDTAAGTLPDGTSPGFDVGEMAAVVRRMLEDIGLTSRFSRLVAVIGHGSSSRNNPHESAYDCGACGGSPGGANARAFAMMANDARVRALLAADGLSIPADVMFIGGMLDTCADAVTWFDAGLLPESHRADFDTLRRACEHACLADAHERCRRFESAPLDITPREAGKHVEGRSVDLAQVRPELGHATNATAVIGRRSRTRGLFLDRRAFLVSYDPTADRDGEILTRTLAAVGPVAAGISLAYFFSAVDRLGYGCDTKLPHNITGLIGVMDGHASDLRTGLPWQAVEIHEPMRLLIVVEAERERIVAAMERLPEVDRLVRNRWVQLVACDPVNGGLAVLEEGAFVPYEPERNDIPVVDRSVSWYSGRRDHLAPARVLAALVKRPPASRPGAA
jgi:uncharacterized protein YbcC (UPF0753/DUF2309 family)